MNRALLEQIVSATLYEGYILYPYRASSCKNARERFTFGRVYPQAYSIAQNGAEPCSAQTECLARAASGGGATVKVTLRFLHPMTREVGILKSPLAQWDGAEPEFQIVPELRVNGEILRTWHEAVEREVAAPAMSLAGLAQRQTRFEFPASRGVEPIHEDGKIMGVTVRQQAALQGSVTVAVHPLGGNLFKISACVLNQTPISAQETQDSEAVLPRLLASTHVVLHLENAEFFSNMDPPPEVAEQTAQCRNLGIWPVLVGDQAAGERDVMLASPIILYDYPKIAPESAGPLFDGTEIDEILTLRILTMSDEEKREMRGVDEQARRLLDRTEALPNESLLKMHGTMRNVPPPSSAAIEFDDFFGPNTRLQGVHIGSAWVKPGDRVRLRPKPGADIMDLALKGQTAIIEAVEQDLEHRVHLAVVLETDPGRDLGMMRQPGHRFFYGVDEIELLGEEVV